MSGRTAFAGPWHTVVLVFFWRETSDGIDRSFTGRSTGHSTGRYAGLNLGGKVGDDAARVGQNRQDVAAAVGVDRDHLLFMDQCHGSEVAVVDGPYAGGAAPRVDALVTAAPGLALAALVADCAPVLLWDNGTDVIAAVHSGRPGLIAGIVPAAVSAMRDLGARQIRAVVGPSVCGRCYEVPEAMRDDATRLAPASRAVSWTGTPAIDIASGVVEQLVSSGVEVSWVAGCTREDPGLYSYRRDGQTGRFSGVIVRQP